MVDTRVKKGGENLGQGAFWAFYLHVIIWAMCSFLLFVINLLTTFLLPPWFLFPALGWGIGIGIHAAVTMMIMDSQGGSGTFWRMFNEKILKNIPKDEIQAVAKTGFETAKKVAGEVSAAVNKKD